VKHFLTLAIGCGLAIALAGCSDPKKPDPKATKTTTPPANTTPTDPPKDPAPKDPVKPG
jgi:PBP1b-binding outer membrane lipoprotein LpoB